MQVKGLKMVPWKPRVDKLLLKGSTLKDVFDTPVRSLRRTDIDIS